MIQAAILTIGDELLIGQTIDTNSAFIAQQLVEAGFDVNIKMTVGDDYQKIWTALDQLAAYNQIIIITGGLGPTADDITKPLLCDYFGGKLVLNNEVLKQVQYLFEKKYNRPEAFLLDRNQKQALVPDNCHVLFNHLGTAPGMWFEKINTDGKKTVFISLPGVPFEMQALISEQTIPLLTSIFESATLIHKNFLTFGAGESTIAEILSDFEQKLPKHIKLAYLPSYGMVKLRLSSKPSQKENAVNEINILSSKIKNLLKDFLIAETDAPIEKIVSELIQSKGLTLSTAESCTGGNIARNFTQFAGASSFFMGSVVAYHNQIKENILKVNSQTLSQYGAVSKSTAIEMAQGVLSILKTDLAVSITGILGPGGGSIEKPVGTVWIAIANKNNCTTHLLQLKHNRERNIKIATLQVMFLIRKFILENYKD